MLDPMGHDEVTDSTQAQSPCECVCVYVCVCVCKCTVGGCVAGNNVLCEQKTMRYNICAV